MPFAIQTGQYLLLFVLRWFILSVSTAMAKQHCFVTCSQPVLCLPLAGHTWRCWLLQWLSKDSLCYWHQPEWDRDTQPNPMVLDSLAHCVRLCTSQQPAHTLRPPPCHAIFGLHTVDSSSANFLTQLMWRSTSTHFSLKHRDYLCRKKSQI